MLVEENKVPDNQADLEMQRAIQVANQADEQERLAALQVESQNQQVEIAQMNAAAPNAEQERMRHAALGGDPEAMGVVFNYNRN